MNVVEVVGKAKQHIQTLFADEKVFNLGLEEIEVDEVKGEWTVTVGFSRPWDEPRNVFAELATPTLPRRTYKIVRIASGDGRILSVKDRETKT